MGIVVDDLLVRKWFSVCRCKSGILEFFVGLERAGTVLKGSKLGPGACYPLLSGAGYDVVCFSFIFLEPGVVELDECGQKAR